MWGWRWEKQGYPQYLCGQITTAWAGKERVARRDTATVTFLSVTDVLNNKLSLETMSQQSCPQKPHPGLLELKSRGDNAGLGSEMVLPNLCHQLGEEAQHERGCGAPCENKMLLLMPTALGFGVWWFLTHWAKPVPAVESPMTAEFPHRSIWSTVVVMSFQKFLGQGRNLPLVATGRLKLVAQFNPCMHWTSKASLSRICGEKKIIN